MYSLGSTPPPIVVIGMRRFIVANKEEMSGFYPCAEAKGQTEAAGERENADRKKGANFSNRSAAAGRKKRRAPTHPRWLSTCGYECVGETNTREKVAARSAVARHGTVRLQGPKLAKARTRWSRGGLFLALPTIVQSASLSSV